jgi:hypothetical protein
MVATSDGLEAFSLENPAQPRRRVVITTPYVPRRIVYSAPYFYTAMWDAGVAIYNAESLGLCERVANPAPSMATKVCPNPVFTTCCVSFAEGKQLGVRLRDVSGRAVAVPTRVEADGQLVLDLSKLAAGVYFVEVDSDRRVRSVKIVKQ